MENGRICGTAGLFAGCIKFPRASRNCSPRNGETPGCQLWFGGEGHGNGQKRDDPNEIGIVMLGATNFFGVVVAVTARHALLGLADH